MCVLHLIRIPWEALLDGLLACWLLSGALFWFAARRGMDKSGVMGRLLMSVAAYAAAFAIWLYSGGSSAGYPWLVGVAILVQMAALELVLCGLGRNPRSYPGLYILGAVLFAAVGILWHPGEPFSPFVPMASSLPGQILLTVNLAGAAVLLGVLMAYGRGRVWLGIPLALAFAGLNLHDLLFVVPAKTTVPWLTVAGALLLPGSWLLTRSWIPTPAAAPEALILGREDGLRHGQTLLDSEAAGILYCYLAGHRPLVDSLGDDVGERVLERAALEVGRVCRQKDVVMRWERGAFLVVFPGILFGDQRALQDRVLSHLSQMQVSWDGRPVPVDVDARLGWGWGDCGASFMDVVSAAGRAMAEGSRGRGSVS